MWTWNPRRRLFVAAVVAIADLIIPLILLRVFGAWPEWMIKLELVVKSLF